MCYDGHSIVSVAQALLPSLPRKQAVQLAGERRMEENGQYLLSLHRIQAMHVCCSPPAATCLLKAGMGMHFLPAAEVVSTTPNLLTVQQLLPSSDLHGGTRCMNRSSAGTQQCLPPFAEAVASWCPATPALAQLFLDLAASQPQAAQQAAWVLPLVAGALINSMPPAAPAQWLQVDPAGLL